MGASSANPGGSGTSTSGGKDDNGDQGRDKMPDSNNECATAGPAAREAEVKVPHLMTIGKWYDPISQRWIVPRGVF